MKYMPQRVFKRLIETRGFKPVCDHYEMNLGAVKGWMILTFLEHPSFRTRCSMDNGRKILETKQN